MASEGWVNFDNFWRFFVGKIWKGAKYDFFFGHSFFFCAMCTPDGFIERRWKFGDQPQQHIGFKTKESEIVTCHCKLNRLHLRHRGSISEDLLSEDLVSEDLFAEDLLNFVALQMKDKQLWVPDAVAAGCMVCSRAFNLVIRRHHCRRCGACMCSWCSHMAVSDKVCVVCVHAYLCVCKPIVRQIYIYILCDVIVYHMRFTPILWPRVLAIGLVCWGGKKKYDSGLLSKAPPVISLCHLHCYIIVFPKVERLLELWWLEWPLVRLNEGISY